MALHGSSYEYEVSEPKKPPRRSGAGLSAFLLLVLGVILAFIFVPGLRKRVLKTLIVRTHQKIDADVLVWTNKQAGTYYCSGDRFYGHGQGSYMKQGEALTRGYQPNLGRYCDGKEPSDSTEVGKKKARDPQPLTAPRGVESGHTASLPVSRR